MANTFYAKQSKATTAAFIADMARFLINDLGGFTGPGWTVVDTYSSAAGTPHEVPGTPTDMDSLAADNGWRTGNLVANDYIILANNNVSFPFQVGIEFQSTVLIRMIIAPKSGFDTAANETDMTTAANWDSAKLTTFDFTTVNSVSNYSIVADSDRFILFFEQWPSVSWTYVGLPDTTTLHTGDLYPACFYSTETNVYFSIGTSTGLASASWRRLSAVDETTEVNCNATGFSAYGGTADSSNGAYDTASSSYRLCPAYLMSTVAGHLGITGKLKGVYNTATMLGNASKGTLGTQAYAFVSDAAYAPVVFDWDGATAI